MIDLANTYNWLCNYPSDIQEHLPTLYDYGLRVDHITEFGVRTGLSTVALLYSSPRKMISYDINPYVMMGAESHSNFEFRMADVLKIEIEETDLLFIDTYHTYKQLSKELLLHGDKSRIYLIFHDTQTFRFRGEDGSMPGLLAAIDEFILTHPWWSMYEHFGNNNGLTILKRGRG